MWCQIFIHQIWRLDLIQIKVVLVNDDSRCLIQCPEILDYALNVLLNFVRWMPEKKLND